jgi:hypothetical protein
MDSEERELALIARPLPRRADSPLPAALENPGTDVREDDPLLEPRADEPGVAEDGSCHPIENPG